MWKNIHLFNLQWIIIKQGWNLRITQLRYDIKYKCFKDFAIQACDIYINLNRHDCGRNGSVINSDKPVCIWKKYDNIVDLGNVKWDEEGYYFFCCFSVCSEGQENKDSNQRENLSNNFMRQLQMIIRSEFRWNARQLLFHCTVWVIDI